MVGDAEYFVPILRASTDEARRPTIDIPEIWDGELVFDPVKINRAPHQSAESQAAP